MPRAPVIIASLALVAGCFSPSYEQNWPFLCTADFDFACPEGFTCDQAKGPDPNTGICVDSSGGGNNNGKCLDVDLEPNDTATTATNLDASLQGHPQGVSLFGVEICTAEDVDYYSFTLGVQKAVTIVIQYQRDQGELGASLMDANLADVAAASPTGAGLQIATTLQAGLYYLKITPGPGGSTNIYDFSLTIGS
jgi:hypothetical protein